MMIPNRRILNALGLVACAGMMSFALYAQHILLLDPCPLCVLQRLVVISLGVVFLAAALHDPSGWGATVYAVLLAVAALVGIGIAGWHVRLQNLPPDQVPSCGPGLDYMLETLPLAEVLGKVFQGSGECAEVVWQFLGLSMPAWVLVCLLGLGFFGVWNNLRRTDR
jgi:disulfide bond formation protein DsbB